MRLGFGSERSPGIRRKLARGKMGCIVLFILFLYLFILRPHTVMLSGYSSLCSQESCAGLGGWDVEDQTWMDQLSARPANVLNVPVYDLFRSLSDFILRGSRTLLACHTQHTQGSHPAYSGITPVSGEMEHFKVPKNS